DGPRDLDGSLAMARAAHAAGTTAIVATPHLRSDFPGVVVEELGARCTELRGALAADGTDLELISGSEISVAWAMQATSGQLRRACVCQRGPHLLIETPDLTATGLVTFLDMLRGRGFRITLAHPERNRHFQRSPGELAQLATEGILLQVNAASLIGRGDRSGA